ncbi:hypothetical protein Q5P01_004880 [Channa striata]|uniref:Uncharacterized protein n=1 Tax=Channa striata TaxID=64152 RepID=A0AA88NHE2_CHASR|nr:hypothetical protein Q5P01_004880 [Channa striata]
MRDKTSEGNRDLLGIHLSLRINKVSWDLQRVSSVGYKHGGYRPSCGGQQSGRNAPCQGWTGRPKGHKPPKGVNLTSVRSLLHIQLKL